MIRIVLALALLASSTAAMGQTITVPEAFRDSNGDGRIDFGSANRAKYGVRYAKLKGRTPEGWVYCGPKGCADAVAAEPAPPIAPQLGAVRIAAARYNDGGPKPITSQWKNFRFGPASVTGTYLMWQNTGQHPTGWRVHDLKLNYVQVTNVYKSGSFADSTWERIEDLNGRAEGLLEFSGPSANVLVSDVRFATTKVNTNPGKVYAAIGLIGKSVKDRGDNILIRRVDISGMRAKHSGYPNADGISTEAGYSNVRYEDVRVFGSSDGGIDTKASPATCARVWLENNARNFRIWNGIGCDGPVWSVNPWVYHIQLMPKADGSSVFRFAHVTFRSKGKQPLIAIDGPYAGRKAKVIIERCTIDVPKGTPRVLDAKKGLKVNWGEGC